MQIGTEGNTKFTSNGIEVPSLPNGEKNSDERNFLTGEFKPPKAYLHRSKIITLQMYG